MVNAYARISIERKISRVQDPLIREILTEMSVAITKLITAIKHKDEFSDLVTIDDESIERKQ